MPVSIDPAVRVTHMLAITISAHTLQDDPDDWLCGLSVSYLVKPAQD